MSECIIKNEARCIIMENEGYFTLLQNTLRSARCLHMPCIDMLTMTLQPLDRVLWAEVRRGIVGEVGE